MKHSVWRKLTAVNQQQRRSNLWFWYLRREQQKQDYSVTQTSFGAVKRADVTGGLAP